MNVPYNCTYISAISSIPSLQFKKEALMKKPSRRFWRSGLLLLLAALFFALSFRVWTGSFLPAGRAARTLSTRAAVVHVLPESPIDQSLCACFPARSVLK